MAKYTFYDSFKKQSGTVVPIFISGIILIALNIYDLIKEEYEKTIYAELFFSFIASSIILLYMSFLIFEVLSRSPYINLGFFLFGLFNIIISPFGLTVIKTLVKDLKSKNYASMLIISLTMYSLYYTFMMAFGGFFRPRRR
jgi:hypothetical protein